MSVNNYCFTFTIDPYTLFMLLFIQWGNSTKLFIKMNKAVSYSGATTYIFCWLRCSSQQKTDLKKNNNVWRVSEHVLYVSAPLLLTPPPLHWCSQIMSEGGGRRGGTLWLRWLCVFYIQTEACMSVQSLPCVVRRDERRHESSTQCHVGSLRGITAEDGTATQTNQIEPHFQSL